MPFPQQVWQLSPTCWGSCQGYDLASKLAVLFYPDGLFLINRQGHKVNSLPISCQKQLCQLQPKGVAGKYWPYVVGGYLCHAMPSSSAVVPLGLRG